MAEIYLVKVKFPGVDKVCELFAFGELQDVERKAKQKYNDAEITIEKSEFVGGKKFYPAVPEGGDKVTDLRILLLRAEFALRFRPKDPNSYVMMDILSVEINFEFDAEQDLSKEDREKLLKKYGELKELCEKNNKDCRVPGFPCLDDPRFC